MTKRMNLLEVYRWLDQQGGDVGWIANVFYTSGGPNRAKTLKSMVSLLQAGHEIGSISFTMPYDQLYLDGKAITPAELRNAAGYE